MMGKTNHEILAKIVAIYIEASNLRAPLATAAGDNKAAFRLPASVHAHTHAAHDEAIGAHSATSTQPCNAGFGSKPERFVGRSLARR